MSAAIFCRFLSLFCQFNKGGQRIAITPKPIFCRFCRNGAVSS